MGTEDICQHIKDVTELTKHPVVISAQPGEKWFWCYEDEVFAEYQ